MSVLSVLAGLVTFVALWSLADVVFAVKRANRRAMDPDFIAVYARFFVLASFVATALWFLA